MHKVVISDLKAAGVMYGILDQAAFASREVILSAGSYHTLHILLKSGVGPKEELAAVGVPDVLDHPTVGKHLQDSVRPRCSAVCPFELSCLPVRPCCLSVRKIAIAGSGFHFDLQ